MRSAAMERLPETRTSPTISRFGACPKLRPAQHPTSSKARIIRALPQGEPRQVVQTRSVPFIGQPRAEGFARWFRRPGFNENDFSCQDDARQAAAACLVPRFRAMYSRRHELRGNDSNRNSFLTMDLMDFIARRHTHPIV